MLVEKEKFLNNNLCDFFIKYHNDNTHLHDPKHGNTSIVCCEKQSLNGNIVFKILLRKLNFFVNKYVKNTFLNYSQIVKWPTGEYQDEHIDFDHHTFTSILYLNDNFEGGQTVVGDKIIKPEKGKIIFFNGNQIKHKVLPIESGTRYTNPTWYITQKEEEILNEQT
tara:strand:- start:98 stop:595 length:498 start_codon:yes stop_codon:yes gene_type:complete